MAEKLAGLDINAANIFTTDDLSTTKTETGTVGVSLKGIFNISIQKGAVIWVGILSLRRSRDDGVTWKVIKNYDSADATAVEEVGTAATKGDIYDIGFETGNYTSGNAVVELSQ